MARALINDPKLVLADEPTGNLDAGLGEEIGATLNSFAREHSALVVIATHNDQVAHLCRRQLLLKGGEIHETARPSAENRG